MRAGLDLRLFRLPHLVQIRVLPLQARDLVLDRRESLLRRVVLLLLHRLALDLQLDHPALETVHRLRLGVDFHLDPRRGFVDQVDCLVGQEAVRDVAMRQLRRRDDRGVGDFDAVVDLVALLQAAQDRDRRFDRRLVDQHFLEAPLERGILFDVLAVFVECRRADAVQLAAGERGLQHVAGIDRALRLAGADHRMQLVDEDDRAAGIGRDVLQHRFQALLEFAAVFRACEELRHVERQHALVLERFRHFAVDDPLREAFDDRRLADARLADQHRVVLGAPLQDLDRAANLVVAADDRIELAFARALGEVDRVLGERLALAFGFLRIDPRPAADRFDRGFERLARQPLLFEQAARRALVVGQRQQEQLAGDELVAALRRFLVGQVQQVVEIAGNRDLAAGPLDFRKISDRRLERRLHLGHRDAGTRQQRRGAGVFLREQCREQVLRLDEAVVVAEGETLRVSERLLELGRQLVESHGPDLV